MKASGKVWLVGAGPGDPGLLTLAGAACLARAEVVLYDRLVHPRLLDLAPAGAERIYVGKQAGGHTLTQDEINALLVARACEGKRVVRLKGGDPYVFGRGGEEAEALVAAGVPFEVVPGVTSAVAAPAYAGIPVTHRGLASSVAVVTGHEDAAKEESSIDWARLATGVDTLVLLMGVANLPDIAEQLVRHGRPPETPAAVIEWGTLPRQRTVSGTLGDIARRAAEAGLQPPAVTVVGEVAGLRETLRWFDNRPLFGKRVLVTRTRRQASALSQALAEAGAEPIELPTIEIEPRADPGAVQAALDALRAGAYAWALFTSANGVELFFGHLRERGLDARAFGSAMVAAIGPGTAEALAGEGIAADLVPEDFLAEGLLRALAEHEMADRRVLVPRAEGARRELIEGLEAQGARVDELTLYRSAVPREPDAEGLRRLRAGELDIVTFASSSAVRNLAEMLGDNPEPLRRPLIACIGPVTAQAAEELGLTVGLVSEEHTIPGLVRALEEKYRSEG
ncbi:MAG: uroporphyrinogen-III C-methyltransferase [Dehalococcoidia bacterium]